MSLRSTYLVAALIIVVGLAPSNPVALARQLKIGHDFQMLPAGTEQLNLIESDSQPLDAGKQCGTSTALSGSGSPSRITDTVTFTAYAIANSYCHHEQTTCNDGDVAFYDGHDLLSRIAVNNCLAVFETGNLTLGRHRITATFEPQSGWHQSSAHLVQIVQKWPTATTLISSPNPSAHRQAVTLTATVALTANGPVPPTGKVRFLNGTKPIALVSLDENSVATFVTSNLPVGTDTITSEYLGDSFNDPSTSSPVDQIVNP